MKRFQAVLCFGSVVFVHVSRPMLAEDVDREVGSWDDPSR
jgi:hypothetical protein